MFLAKLSTIAVVHLGFFLVSGMGCVPSTSAVAPTVQPGPVDENAPTDFSQTPSGLKYKILRKTGDRKPTIHDTVTVHYRGWLDSGKEFDSSYRRGKPATFALQQVVPGWTEGLQYVEQGGMIELEIPSQLGYGASGAGGDIPPNSTLHFIVELIEIE